MKKSEFLFNAYADSIGSSLGDLMLFLEQPSVRGLFRRLYLLPSVFNSDYDRGFSVVSYEANEALFSEKDRIRVKGEGISLMLDLVLNHLSVNSPQFQDIVRLGDRSRYRDFFVDWNRFWEEKGTMTAQGWVLPEAESAERLYLRKPSLPVLVVEDAQGEKHAYWNTFYSARTADGGLLGQMDLNIHCREVWDFYGESLNTLKNYGADIIRLDAFPYLSKIPGRVNYFNEPESWDILERIREIAAPLGMQLLPEVHEKYENRTHEKLSEKGYLVYDYFLPGLILDALDSKDASVLAGWGREILQKDLHVIHVLSTHDGIPVKDLGGLLPPERVEALVCRSVERGGVERKIYGSADETYQVFSTFYSALGESEDAMVLARAIQLFFPGTPQIYYLDLLCGKNDPDVIRDLPEESKREINRTGFTVSRAIERLSEPVVQRQLELLRYVHENLVGQEILNVELQGEGPLLRIRYVLDAKTVEFTADVGKKIFSIREL